MLARVTVSLLAAAVALFACGPHAPKPMHPSRARSSMGDGVRSHVVVDTTGGRVRFAIEVENSSRRRVELNFSSGRTHDFAVLDAGGREVWRWSTGRLFTQSMQNRLLDASGSAEFAERWTPAAPGRYTVVAQLHSLNYPLTEQVEFSLP